MFGELEPVYVLESEKRNVRWDPKFPSGQSKGNINSVVRTHAKRNVNNNYGAGDSECAFVFRLRGDGQVVRYRIEVAHDEKFDLPEFGQ